MTPRTALATEYGPLQADDILATLRKAGYIVVVKDAIRLAQIAAANDNASAGQRAA
jgi:hypothetical protein